MRNYRKAVVCLFLAGLMTTMVTACGQTKESDGKVNIEIVQYKPEATKFFDQLEDKFNETHDDIHLTISSYLQILPYKWFLIWLY